MEIWKPIKGVSDAYEVSNEGRVRSLPRTVYRHKKGPLVCAGKILTPTMSRGYPYVTICYHEGQKRVSVAKLVCEAFHGPKPKGKEVAHSDGDPGNARADNVRWATKLENAADKKRHGTENFGEKHPRSKITEAQALEIIERISRGESQHGIANAIGVTRSIVCSISMGETWRHLQRPWLLQDV